jgi:hypothetical protein
MRAGGNMNSINKMTLGALALILTACGGGGGGGDSGPAGPTLPACLSAEEVSLVGQLNTTRAGVGKAALPVDTRLVQTARKNAQTYLTNGSLAGFDFGGTYGYTGIGGTSGSDFASASEFWTAFLAQVGGVVALQDFVKSDTPKHVGVGVVDQANGKHTYSFIIGSDPGAAVNGTCTP